MKKWPCPCSTELSKLPPEDGLSVSLSTSCFSTEDGVSTALLVGVVGLADTNTGGGSAMLLVVVVVVTLLLLVVVGVTVVEVVGAKQEATEREAAAAVGDVGAGCRSSGGSSNATWCKRSCCKG